MREVWRNDEGGRRGEKKKKGERGKDPELMEERGKGR